MSRAALRLLLAATLTLAGLPALTGTAAAADPTVSSSGPVVSLTCVDRRTSRVRVPSGRTCRPSERVVHMTVDAPRDVCATLAGPVYLVGRRFDTLDCVDAGGFTRRIPRAGRFTLCTARTTRWLPGGFDACRRGERAVRIRNVAPRALGLVGRTVADRAPAGTVVGRLVATDPNVGDRVRWRLVIGRGGNDNDAFRVAGDQLVLRAAADHAKQDTYQVRVGAVDTFGRSRSRSFRVDVTSSVLDGVSLDGDRVAENEPAGTRVGRLGASPASVRDVTYALVDGDGDADNALFALDGDVLRTTAVLDHEQAATRTVRVRASSPSGPAVERTLTLRVDDVNEAPTALRVGGSLTVGEHAAAGTVVARVGVDDPDAGDTHTLALDETDAAPGLFRLVGDELRTTRAPGDGRITHRLRLTATDRGGLSTHAPVTVTVDLVNDAPTRVTLDGGEVVEGRAGAVVGTLGTEDRDGSAPYRYALAAGAGDDDNAQFEVVGDELRTRVALDLDDGARRSVRVRVTDAGGAAYEEVLAVRVTLGPRAPHAVGLAPASVDENAPARTRVGALSAQDRNPGDTHTYTLVPGALDNGLFAVDGADLVTTAALDHEEHATRTVRVTATDSTGLTRTEDLVVTVTDVGEAPVLTGFSASSLAENMEAGTVAGTLSATDPDRGDATALTYALVSGPGDDDNAAFRVDGDRLVVVRGLDFETRARFSLRVRVTDPSGLVDVRVLTGDVLDGNDAPTALTLDHDEVYAGRADELVGTLGVVDADGSAPYTYALVTGDGDDDNDRFVVVGDELRTGAVGLVHDGEERTVRVRVSDADGASYERVVRVRVLQAPAAPTLLTLTPAEVRENAPAGTLVGTLAATDPNAGDTFTFTVVPGAGATDNAAFEVRGSTLVTTTPLDHEAGATRSVRLRVTDSDGLALERALVVDVLDVNEPPTAFTVNGPGTVTEHAPAGARVATFGPVVDPDAGDTHTYEVVTPAGRPGAGGFVVVGDELRTTRAFDDSVEEFDVDVRVSDAGGLTATQTVRVTLVLVNDPPHRPVVTIPAPVPENSPVGTVVGTVIATDPDRGDTLTVEVLAGPVRVSGTNLVLVGPLDYEATRSWTMTVRATDAGGLTASSTFTIEVQDVNEAPVTVRDEYSGAVGNTPARLGTDPGTGPAVPLTGDLPLRNDSDPEGDALSVVPGSTRTTLGGTVRLSADGSFRYLPAAGVEGATDTFGYTVTDGELTTPATATITLGTRSVWYVDRSATAGGDGTFARPFTSLAPLDGLNDADNGDDTIFMAQGTYPTGPGLARAISLENGQRLVGHPAGLTVGGEQFFAPGGPVTITGTTSQGVVLGEGTTVGAVDITSTGTGTPLVGTGVTRATVEADVTVTGGTGATVLLSGGIGTIQVLGPVRLGQGHPALDVSRNGLTTFAGVSSQAVSGGVWAHGAGTVQFDGTLTLRTGTSPALWVSSGRIQAPDAANTVTTTSGTAVDVQDATILPAGLRLASVQTSGAKQGVVVRRTGALGSLTLSGGTVAASTGPGAAVHLEATRSPSVSGLTVRGGLDDAVVATRLSGTATFAGNHLADNVGDGLRIESHSSDFLTSVDVTGSVVVRNGGDGIQVASTGGTLSRATVRGNTVGGSGSHGIVVSAAASTWTGALGFDVDDNTVDGSRSANVVVSGAGIAGTFEGRVRRNRVAQTSCGANGTGIQTVNEAGTGSLVVAVTDNQVGACARRALHVLAGDGAAGIQATLTDNTSTYAVGSDALLTNLGTTSADTGSYCLDVRGTAFTGVPQHERGILLRHRWGTLAYAGLGPGTPLGTRVAAANPDAGLVEDLSTRAPVTPGPATCTLPSF